MKNKIEIKEGDDPIVEAKKLSQEVMKAVAEQKTALDEERKGRKQDADKMAKLEKSISEGLETVQKLQSQAAEEKSKREALEVALSRVGQTAESKGRTDEKTRKAFDMFMRQGEIAEGFKAAGGQKGIEIEIKTLATNNDPAGGYFIMPELADFVVGRAFETSPLRQVARVVTTVAPSIDVIVDDDEASGGWAGEGSTSSSTTTPTVGKKTINAYKLDAEPKATVEMLQDAGFNIEAWLGEKVADKFGRLENTAFFSGNGVNKPRGLLTYSAWSVAGTYERGKIEQVNLGGTSTLTSDGLIGLQGSLKEVYQARAAWLMKRATYTATTKLKGSDSYYFGNTFLKDGIATPMLLGKRVIFCDDMEAVAASALAIAYGDFSVGYTIVDKLGLNVLRDPFTSKGNVILYTSKRVGGDVTNFDAFKIGKVAA